MYENRTKRNFSSERISPIVLFDARNRKFSPLWIHYKMSLHHSSKNGKIVSMCISLHADSERKNKRTYHVITVRGFFFHLLSTIHVSKFYFFPSNLTHEHKPYSYLWVEYGIPSNHRERFGRGWGGEKIAMSATRALHTTWFSR